MTAQTAAAQARAAILLGVPARTQQETAELPGTAGVP